MAEQDPIVAFDSARAALLDAQTRASNAEAERDQHKAEAEALQKEKDEHWKSQIKTAKKLHPGKVSVLKMFVGSSREEWEETKSFFEMFDGHLPVALVRISEGVKTLLTGGAPEETK